MCVCVCVFQIVFLTICLTLLSACAPPPTHTHTHTQGYLWTLKCCHSGADMDTAAEMAKGQLDGDTCWMLFDMLKNR